MQFSNNMWLSWINEQEILKEEDAPPPGVSFGDDDNKEAKGVELGDNKEDKGVEKETKGVEKEDLELTPPKTDEETPKNIDDEDIAEEDDEKDNFNNFKKKLMELSVKSDVESMLELVRKYRDNLELNSGQKKFVEDNIQVLLLRQDSNIEKATKEIRTAIKENLDNSSPATFVMKEIVKVLQKIEPLRNILIKLLNLWGLKGELHRKYIAALLGCIQTGSSNNKSADLLYFTKELKLQICTRFATQFGEIPICKWSLHKDDPEKILAEAELDRLKNGSPEEKQVLRRRVILESIANTFKKQLFLIHVTNPEGTIYSLGWDFSASIKEGYHDGRFIVRGQKNVEREAMINDRGDIITLLDIDIFYIKETGHTDENGKPEMVEVPFMQRKDGNLLLSASLETLKIAAGSIPGIYLDSAPYSGNPSDLKVIQRCFPSVAEILNKKCG